MTITPLQRHSDDLKVVLLELLAMPEEQWRQPATAFLAEYAESSVLLELSRQLFRKDSRRNEFHTTRKLLEDAGMSASVTEFTSRLRELETNGPSPGGDHKQFAKAQSYREAVVRLSLSMVATTAFGLQSIEDEISAMQSDDELNLLF